MNSGWSEDLAIGVTEIDDQHKEIFSRFDRLFVACSEGRGKDEVLQLISFLEEYIKEHFAAEEKLQVRNAYPEYANHKAQHTRFIGDVKRLALSFREEGATLPLVIKTNQTLSSWLVQHIAKSDKEFAAFLRSGY